MAAKHQAKAGFREILADRRVRDAAQQLLAALQLAQIEIRSPGAARAQGKDIDAIVSAAIAQATGARGSEKGHARADDLMVAIQDHQRRRA